MAQQIRLSFIPLVILLLLIGLTLPAGTANAHTNKCPKFEQLFKQYGLLPVDTFSYIAWRESRCNPKAINAKWDKNGNLTYHLNKNKTWDSGLLQINSGHRETVKRICKADLDKLMEVDCNLKVAKYILDNGGLNHWRATYP